MSQLPPMLNANIVAVSMFAPAAPPIPLDRPVLYDGKPLFCHVRPLGSQLAFSIDGNPPNQLGGVTGNFTSAVADVSYEGSTPGRTASTTIAYNGRRLDFYLRFDKNFTRATAYIVEKPVALLQQDLGVVAPARAAGVEESATAEPDSGLLVFFAIADGGGNDDPNAPYKLVFIEKQIIVPDYLNHKTATILFGPPPVDGGGELGPMAIQIDP